MKVIYLDQNLIGNLARPPKDRARCEHLSAFWKIAEELVRKRIAVFPYSSVHLEETARLDDSEHRRTICRIWLSLNGGYRFMDSKVIRGEQAKTVWDRRPVLFSSHWAVGEAYITFAQELEAPDAEHRKLRARTFIELGEYWGELTTDQINKILRYAEANGYASAIIKTIERIVHGKANDILCEAQRPEMELLDDLFWHALEQNHPDPHAGAFAFIQKRLFDVPCITIESILIERLSVEFSKSLPKPSDPEKGKIDHSVYDTETIAHFVPYCDAALLDNAMVNRLEQNRMRLPEVMNRVQFFTLGTLEKLVVYLQSLATAKEVKLGTALLL